MRLTKYLILLSCSFILLLNGLQNRFRLQATTKTRVSFYSKLTVRPYPNQVTVDTSSNVDLSNQIWTQCLKCLRTKQFFQNYFVLTCVNVDRDSLTFICCHIILCRFEKYEIFTNICQFSCFNQYLLVTIFILCSCSGWSSRPNQKGRIN